MVKAFTEKQWQYREKFKDPRWQKLRLKVLERDMWYCQICYDPDNTLHIHHRYYTPNTEPWDYPQESLVTLCEECHQRETDTISESIAELVLAAKKQFFSLEIKEIAEAIEGHKIEYPSEVVGSIILDSFLDREACKKLEDHYFCAMKKRLNHRDNTNE